MFKKMTSLSPDGARGAGPREPHSLPRHSAVYSRPGLARSDLVCGFLVVLAWFCFSGPALSAAITPLPTPLAVDQSFTHADLTRHVLLLEDPKHEWQFEDLRQGRLDDQFQPASASGTNLSFTRSAWWVTFTLTNTSDREQRVILRQAYPLIDHVQLWERTQSPDWQTHVTGDRLPFGQRGVPHHDFLFPLTLEPRSQHRLYMRFETQGAMDIALEAYTPVALLQRTSTEQLGYGVYYGGVLVLVIYNLFIFVAMRDKAFLYYLLYILCLGLYMSSNDGLFFQFAAPNNPNFAHDILLVLLGLALLFAVQFARHILTIPDFSRKLDQAALAVVVALAVTTLGTFVLPYWLVILTLSLLTLVVMPLIFVMGLLRLFSGYPPARYFMLAWSTFIFGTIIYMIKVFGFYPRTFFTENAFQFGSLIEIVLLSLALGSRVNQLKRQRDTDDLTEISNRRRFDSLLRREFARSLRTGQPLSLLMVDIDHFKQFNDTFGHGAGDEVLKEVGAQLRSIIRKPMIPCRFGGEEFAVILPRTRITEARITAERLREHMAKTTLAQHRITVSIGVASRDQMPFPSPYELLQAADSALYTAKEAGRNRVELYRQPVPVLAPPTADTVAS